MGLASAKDICNRDWLIEFDDGLCHCERLGLRICRRMEACQGRVPSAQVVDRRGEVVGDESGVALIRIPDLVDGLAETLPQLRPDILRLRPVVGEREIELQDFRGEGLDGDALARIDPVGGPDEQAEDKSGQQCE